MFSIPAENSTLTYSRLTVIAGDDLPATGGQESDEIALEIDALHQPGEIAGFEALQIGFDSLSAGGLARGIGQETLSVEPARPHHGGASHPFTENIVEATSSAASTSSTSVSNPYRGRTIPGGFVQGCRAPRS